MQRHVQYKGEKGKGYRRVLNRDLYHNYKLPLILLRLLSCRLRRRCCLLLRLLLSLLLLVHLLEESQRSVLCGIDGRLDLLGGHGSVTGLALDGEFTEFGDELGNLLLLRGVELVLELVHGCGKGPRGQP